MTQLPTRAIAFRRMRPDDLADIVEIERESFSDPWNARSFAHILERDESIFDVAVRKASADEAGGTAETEEVVAFCIGHVVADEAEIANVAVRRSCRREGIARRLLEHVIQQARARGARELFLEVRVSNEAARALYSTMGFVEVGRRSRYYDRPVEDALILQLRIP